MSFDPQSVGEVTAAVVAAVAAYFARKGHKELKNGTSHQLDRIETTVDKIDRRTVNLDDRVTRLEKKP